MSNSTESHKRSLAKGFTWRIIATTITTGLIYIATGDILISTGLGVLDFVIKMTTYYAHERTWNTIAWGITIKEQLSSTKTKKEDLKYD